MAGPSERSRKSRAGRISRRTGRTTEGWRSSPSYRPRLPVSTPIAHRCHLAPSGGGGGRPTAPEGTARRSPVGLVGQGAGCGARTRPTPRSATSMPSAKPSVAALARSLAVTVDGLAGRGEASTSSHQRVATPATWGQAMLVPLLVVRPPPFLADRMATPGPLIWAKVLEKGAIASPWGDWARAATDTTPSAAAGSSTPISKLGSVSRRLPLPAAATTTQPVPNGSRLRIICSSVSNIRRFARYASSAREVARSAGTPASTWSLTNLGKSSSIEIDTTRAPFWTAHCSPCSIASELPRPLSPSTLPIRARPTPRATPIRVPSTSRPRTVPAQWVPWPTRSPLPEPVKSCSTSVTPVKAGWAASMPVSRTATTTSAPVRLELSAPTAPMPQAVVAAASAPSSTGRTSLVGMTGASARTPGSRARARTSSLASSSTSTRGSLGAFSSIEAAPLSNGPAVLAPRRSRRITYAGIGSRPPSACRGAWWCLLHQLLQGLLDAHQCQRLAGGAVGHRGLGHQLDQPIGRDRGIANVVHEDEAGGREGRRSQGRQHLRPVHEVLGAVGVVAGGLEEVPGIQEPGVDLLLVTDDRVTGGATRGVGVGVRADGNGVRGVAGHGRLLWSADERSVWPGGRSRVQQVFLLGVSAHAKRSPHRITILAPVGDQERRRDVLHGLLHHHHEGDDFAVALVYLNDDKTVPLQVRMLLSGAQNGSPKGEDLLAWKLNGNFLATVWVGLVDRYGVGLPDSRPGTDLVIPEVDVHTPDRSVVGARGLDDDHPELEGEPGPPADVLAVSAGHVIAVDSSHDTPGRSHRSSFLLL